MIKIEHFYATSARIDYIMNQYKKYTETMIGSMDAIAEEVCHKLVKYNWQSADVSSTDTGEILMVITRE